MYYKISVKAYLLCVNNGRALMQIGSSVESGKFYRLVGGHVEPFERSETAVRREIMEALHSGISDLKLVDVIENIFTYNRKRGHEIVFVYSGKLTKKSLYSGSVMERIEDGKKLKAYWVPLKELERMKDKVYPKGIYKHILREIASEGAARKALK